MRNKRNTKDSSREVQTFDALRDTSTTLFLSMIGEKLREAWLVWDVDGDEWFSDEPVVLRFGERMLALSFSYLSRLSLMEAQWSERNFPEVVPGEFQTRWRDDAHPCVRNVIGSTLSAVEGVGFLMATRAIDGTEQRDAWLLNGIGFKFEDGKYLTIFNALDTNAMSNKRESGDKLRYTGLV